MVNALLRTRVRELESVMASGTTHSEAEGNVVGILIAAQVLDDEVLETLGTEVEPGISSTH